MHLLKYFSFLLEACYIYIYIYYYYYYFDNIRGLSFHFDLYSVRVWHISSLKDLRNLSLFFVYSNFFIIITFPNMCKSLSSLVMHNNTEPKFLTCEKDLSKKLKCVGVFWEDTNFEFDVWKGWNYVDVCQVVH
jgi:hypothetical protein